MKIFSATQIREWDKYTVEHEPVSSLDLMERAAEKCYSWLSGNFPNPESFIIFCGCGNNGGDGLAIARKLRKLTPDLKIYILAGQKKTDNFIINFERLVAENIHPQFLSENDEFPPISENTIIIDALFGTGLNKPVEGHAAEIIQHINNYPGSVISIDIPSGLFADKNSTGKAIVKASYTLSFQVYKLAFFLQENQGYIGKVHILDIGLHRDYYYQTDALFNLLNREFIKDIYKPREAFSHKYNYGHALIYAGSRNMAGAAILSAKACLRSGAGLVTVHTEAGLETTIHTAFPEALTSSENNSEKLWNKKNVIGIGPGLEKSDSNSNLLHEIIIHFKGPLVIDATALALLYPFRELLIQRHLHPAILTPHTGEFEKLFGKTNDETERLFLALHQAAVLNCYIILKGHYTLIATPQGKGFFNTSGNPGMATAGSGDVLTGIITGLLAQGYTESEACFLGVYLHGLAGDISAKKFSEESLIAGDIIENLGGAFTQIK